ncbi:MAG: beta-propeller domain-containing protein [Blautia sp.]|nr:beta-propeller domain-containing protein [Blautia sp.]
MEEQNRKEMERLMKQIEESSEDIRIPESLEPERVKEQLRGKKQERRTFSVRHLAEAAAVIVLVAAMGGAGIYGKIRQGDADSSMSGGAEAGVEPEEALAGGADAGLGADAGEAEPVKLPKKAAVGSYRLASDYEEVYAAIENSAGGYVWDYDDTVFNTTDGVAEDGAEYAATSVQENQKEVEEIADARSEMDVQDGDFSKTNTQVEGVDESDFIKNDGSYLYVQTGEKVSLVDIRGDKMKTVAEIEPKLDTGADICEMYVDGDRLYLIVQKRESNLETDAASSGAEDVWSSDKAMADVEDVYYVNENMTVELQTYDIAGRSGGALVGTVSQDGGYYDSRKVGDYIYLFTREDLYSDYRIYDDGVKTKDTGQGAAIPVIDGEKAAADCIYVQDQVAGELIISSVDAKSPDKTVDYMVLMNNYAQIYMSTEAIYLYSEDYEWTEGDSEGKTYTDIAKFSYKDGILNGVGEASVRGGVMDTFAISEGNGVLRVLTTEWSANSENRLYLLDENLKELGFLSHIAEGEEVYAARYIGNTAYFITYHNTDPLFAVDISDPANPKMLGQIEISGFSDYLHPYGNGMLLGIGYETDPKTSERLGVKLVMFDISDPVDLKILDTVTVDGTFCGAASYYKSALADAGKNLIGFSVTDWRQEGTDRIRYLLYTWKDGEFVKLLKANMDEESSWDQSKTRGLYAGNRFYLVNQNDGGYLLRSYDMEAGYEQLDELEVK